MHFRHAEPIAPERDGGHRCIAEGIVDHRPDGAFRQLGLDIRHPVAQQFPRRRYLFGGHLVFEDHMDQAFTEFRGGILDPVDFAHAADFLFDRPGNQAFDLLHRHAGIFCVHQRFADRDQRVFQFRKADKRSHTAQNDQ